MKKMLLTLFLFFISLSAYAQQTQGVSVSAVAEIPQQIEQTPQDSMENFIFQKKGEQQQNIGSNTAEEKIKNNEQVHPYLRFSAGLTYTTFEIENENLCGFQSLFDFAAGIQYKKSRFEFIYQTRASMSDTIFIFIDTYCTITNDSYMFNYFYNFISGETFDFYIGAGAGVNKWESTLKPIASGNIYNDSGNSFIGGVYLGLSINIPTGIFTTSLDLGIDYYYIDKPLMNNIVPKAGIRFTF